MSVRLAELVSLVTDDADAADPELDTLRERRATNWLYKADLCRLGDVLGERIEDRLDTGERGARSKGARPNSVAGVTSIVGAAARPIGLQPNSAVRTPRRTSEMCTGPGAGRGEPLKLTRSTVTATYVSGPAYQTSGRAWRIATRVPGAGERETSLRARTST